MSLFNNSPAYFKPTKIAKKEQSELLFKNKNYTFWRSSVIFPAAPFILVAVILITQVFIPLYFFETKTTELPAVAKTSVLGFSSGFRDFTFNELEVQNTTADANTPEFFYLTVPSLGIKDAVVKTNSLDLSPDDYIGHYNGSALPGSVGTTYLYGHSVLPVFYNPRNYKTIFSKLDKLVAGDEIIVSYNNVKHSYTVESSSVLKVSEVHPLKNKRPEYLNDSSLVLMTCWPAGTKMKRFEVVAVLAN